MYYTHVIFAAILLSYAAQLIIPGYTELMIFNPSNLHPWMLVTPIFLHGGLTHLILNCFALMMFGPYMEEAIGSKRFLLFFLATGIAGNLLYWFTILLGIIPPTLALGASGSIYGILGGLSVLAPNLTLFMFGFIPMKIRHATVFWIVFEFLNSFNPGSGIGSAAHLGGLVFGLIAMKLYVDKRKQAMRYY